MVVTVYLDLAKAFDIIGHALLLNKLTAYGITGKELNWLTGYLFAMTQIEIIEIENSRSSSESI